jgi:Ca2+-binding RTX toxin-like protein
MKRTLALAAVATLSLSLASPAAAEVLDGTEEANTLIGGKQNDLLYGRGGDDWLKGNRGDDAHRGGDGHDDIDVGDGRRNGFNDAVGGAGNDDFAGGRGYTYAEGSEGDDKYWASEADMTGEWDQQDYFRGNEGDDRGTLRRGHDTWEPDEGADKGHLGGQSDYAFMYPDGEKDVIWCGAGKDWVEYFGDIDPLDVRHDCERVIDPDKSDGVSDTRAAVERRLAR